VATRSGERVADQINSKIASPASAPGEGLFRLRQPWRDEQLNVASIGDLIPSRCDQGPYISEGYPLNRQPGKLSSRADPARDPRPRPIHKGNGRRSCAGARQAAAQC
jgi:hypothetical protein